LDALSQLITARTHRFTFVDLCAGPGGFIEYILYRAASLSLTAQGIGMTLCGPQDFNLDAFTPLAHSQLSGFEACYGADGTGDVTRPENLLALKEAVDRVMGGGGVDLVTGDGGFNTAGDELNQEFHVKEILVGQVSLICGPNDVDVVCK
jgi:cap1 methyltransferase